MIQANEIKPNNIIDTPYGIATVYGISKDCVQITLKDNESIFDFDLEDAKPIELTEDILLKCGFEVATEDGGVVGSYSYWSNGKIDLNNLGFWWFVVTTDFHHPRIDYLHQLQNLYFALTQTELEINL